MQIEWIHEPSAGRMKACLTAKVNGKEVGFAVQVNSGWNIIGPRLMKDQRYSELEACKAALAHYFISTES
jgi:hypothetical protein